MESVANPPPLQLGQVLAAERERQGLSRVDVAQRLHMSAWQVEALEVGDYSRLPRGTFLRGFVRNYARVLGIDAQAALGSLAEAVPVAPAPKIVVPSQNIRFDPLGQRFASPWFRASGVAAVAFLLALAATYWWVFVRPSPPATTIAARKEAQPQPTPQTLAAATPRPQDLAAASLSAPAPVAPREVAKEEAAPPADRKAGSEVNSHPRPVKPADVVSPLVQVQETRSVPGARTVKLRFKGRSWVEIRERGGKVLLSKLNEAGSETEVSGRPPLSVVVGNAPDVTMLYDDREFSLEPHTKVAVARFTLE